MNGFTQLNENNFDWGLFRRDVRKDVCICALFVFFFYVVNFLVSLIPAFFGTLSSASVQNLINGNSDVGNSQDFISSPDFQDMIGEVADSTNASVGLMSIIAIAAGGCVFVFLRKKRFFTDIAMPMVEPLTPRIFLILVFASQAIQLVYSLIITLVDALLPEGVSLLENYSDMMSEFDTPSGMICVVLVGPVFEELIFRGAIMGTLRRYGDNFAILFSALIFGFYHMVILQIPFAFVMGLLLGYTASRWSLRTSIALHIIVNGLTTLIGAIDNNVFAIVIGLFMIVCTIATVVFLIKWNGVFKIRIRTGAAYYPRTYINGFSSITLWIYMCVMTAAGILLLIFI